MLYARFSRPMSGYPHDQKRAAAAGLLCGNRYIVDHVNMGQSNTSVYLVGYDGAFNSVQFDFEDEDGKLHNIYRDPTYNPYIGL